MASLTISVVPPGSDTGRHYTQKTITSTDASSGIEIVPALTGFTAVIDKLYINTAATEVVSILAGTDALIDVMTLASGSMHLIEKIRSDTISEAITLDTVDAGTITAFVQYHYE